MLANSCIAAGLPAMTAEQLLELWWGRLEAGDLGGEYIDRQDAGIAALLIFGHGVIERPSAGEGLRWRRGPLGTDRVQSRRTNRMKGRRRPMVLKSASDPSTAYPMIRHSRFAALGWRCA